MKIQDLMEINGSWMPVERDATPEEEAELQSIQTEQEEMSQEEMRIRDLEAALSALLSGRTE